MENSFITLEDVLSRLANLSREGWVRFSVPFPETVSDHSFRTAFLAVYYAELFLKEGIDPERVLQIALCHDLGEALIGDILPPNLSGVSKHEKAELERSAVLNISKHNNFPELIELFDTYAEEKEPAALAVKDLDKLDMLVQAYEYILKYPSIKGLSEFMENHFESFHFSFIQETVTLLKELQEGKKKPLNKDLKVCLEVGKLKENGQARKMFSAAVLALAKKAGYQEVSSILTQENMT